MKHVIIAEKGECDVGLRGDRFVLEVLVLGQLRIIAAMAGTSEVVAGRISMVSNVVDGPRRARQCSHGSEEDSGYGPRT